ncbi:MAG: OmpA family protein [Aulosira sp. ZfuVER01]|nr:right-handed parallel beta-helix repeat-containing protein [Aulosira sp. ZfuVER01]MDZ8001870.1 right-handed parallel beta-helix repeat-containing protein [Aulosira sp. DedVER01a]MDZ8053346.1 right-handed parallel beta-helix repeat-containing protein [Aulosira sp. ZfuCHP01]
MSSLKVRWLKDFQWWKQKDYKQKQTQSSLLKNNFLCVSPQTQKNTIPPLTQNLSQNLPSSRSLRTLRFVSPVIFYLLTSEAALSQIPTPSPQVPVPTSLRVVVNSNQDGNVKPDNQLTLREAIQLVNGTLSVAQLSSVEKAQVQPAIGGSSRIEFSLPTNATTILLQSQLPDLASPGLIIDGATQPGYNASTSATAEIAIPIPVVAIAPAPDKEIFRGLTVVADGVTIRGLSLYGFNANAIKQQLGNILIYDGVPKPVTLTTPPGDIVIAHRLPPPNTTQQQPPNSNFPFYNKDVPPKNVVIENNWLGLTTTETVPEKTSAFGVYVFNSQGATIRRNRIYYHDGSAIITSVRGENTLIQENIIVGNGIAGMPDALRIEGVVSKSQITSNLICANDGAGVYLFKPQGDVQIRNNRITYNGRRLRRAAVYLMGSDHQVTGNEISYQTGPGVVVTAFPESKRNIIQNNSFAALEGLSIDLNAQRDLDVSNWQRGDGPNPKRNSGNRRLDTGNGAINAPEFKSREFLPSGNSVTLEGKADPGSEVTIYRLGDYQQGKQALYEPGYGALSQPLASAPVDAKGNFSITVANVQAGDIVSAIATDPKYGTSEPAIAAFIGPRGTTPSLPPANKQNPIPQCTSRPAPPQPPTPPTVIPPTQLKIRAPRNIHFALDKSLISPASAIVLDRVAEVLQQNPLIVIEIQGHTDPRASDDYNLALGRRRALATRNYLLRQGIPAERMTIRSLGESQRVSEGSSRLDYARDRRAEIIYKDVRGIDIIIEGQEQDLQLEPDRGRR